ncbi:hypothetical protein AB0D78_47320 [Streptomyces avermitilis]|uniref:hypothetical protein n=1 Tax=Streptomyces avermitilis TaxID=33903 RepID=UPI0033CB63E4
MKKKSLALCGLVSVVLLTGCSGGGNSSGGHAARPAAEPTSLPTAATSRSATDPHAPTTARVPDLAARDVTVVMSGKSLTGRREYTIPKGTEKGDTLAAAVDCKGSGKLLVALEPINTSFTVTCEKEIVPSLNVVRFSKKRDLASIAFVPSGSVTWSFAVGWDADPPERDR